MEDKTEWRILVPAVGSFLCLMPDPEPAPHPPPPPSDSFVLFFLKISAIFLVLLIPANRFQAKHSSMVQQSQRVSVMECDNLSSVFPPLSVPRVFQILISTPFPCSVAFVLPS